MSPVAGWPYDSLYDLIALDLVRILGCFDVRDQVIQILKICIMDLIESEILKSVFAVVTLWIMSKAMQIKPFTPQPFQFCFIDVFHFYTPIYTLYLQVYNSYIKSDSCHGSPVASLISGAGDGGTATPERAPIFRSL